MDRLNAQDVRTGAAYEADRDSERRRLVDIKRHRRVQLGERFAIVFENVETVRGALEEGLRSEQVSRFDQVAAEVDNFNRIVPRPGELSACVYLEVGDAAALTIEAAQLAGVERAITLEVGDEPVVARVEEVDTGLGPPPVHHLRFPVSPVQAQAWRSGAPIRLRVDHPVYQATADFTPEQRMALAEDLR